MIAIPNMDKPKSCIECDSDFGYAIGCKLWYEFKDWRKQTHPDCPIIDIVPCKECKWWDNNDDANRCTHEDGGMWAKPNAFCSYGERANTDQHNIKLYSGCRDCSYELGCPDAFTDVAPLCNGYKGAVK